MTKLTKNNNLAVVLLSGGYDSPVAAYNMIKAGYKIILVHFQNINSFSKESVKDKVILLAKQLSNYQKDLYIYIIPFKDLQQIKL